MNQLLQGMRKAQNYTRTENNAITHKSTLNDLLDFYYHAPARRGQDNTQLFASAYAEDAINAVKALFYIRDIRGGSKIGERETFRQGLRYLADNHRAVFNAIIPLVPEYGRWDDLVEFVDNQVVVSLIDNQLSEDYASTEGVSLLAKWMPSINTSSKTTRALAKKWARALDLNEGEYRKVLSLLRNKIGIVERLMSAGEFAGINYESVPSKASMQYRKAFSKRDGVRYGEYITAVKAGIKKINSATLYPYEIVSKYLNGMREDATLEEQWKALPNYAGDINALVMADVSGSMSGRPMEISISLAIYFAERNRGAFKDYFMTFSGNPSLERVKGNTLSEKVYNVGRANWTMNTNIQAAFDLILTTAVKGKVSADEMPRMLFIISDMEFDSHYVGGNKTNFDVIKRKYANAGYVMPTLVFWNVDSRNDQTPVTEKEEGVFLVSGASAGIFKSAINAKATNPMDMMLEVLNDTRYDAISVALNG